MSGPCPRPECGGDIHTDGWGTPIRCPARRCPRCDCPDGADQCEHCKVCPHYEPDAIICPLVQRTPHDAHEYEGLQCPGWAPDDGTRPEQPPELSELEQLRADSESLRYQIQRVREALGTDQAPVPGLDDLRRDRDELRALLYEILGHFVHKGHPGEPCLSSGWISVRTVDRWRTTLNEAVAAASKENKA
jgi:hypothetical protein